jgi:hypothetical protein
MKLISLVSIGLLLFYAAGVLVYRLWRVNNKPLWGDGFTYLRTARQIAETGGLPNMLDFYQVGKGQGDPFTLPPLLMLLLVPFRRMEYRYVTNISYLIDILISIALCIFSLYLVGATCLQAVAASLIYLLSPINTFTQTQITPRQLGALFLLLFASFFSLYMQRGDLHYLSYCPFLISLLLLSQRMATQILLLGAPFITGFLCIIDPGFGLAFGLSLAGGIFLAFLLTGGRYRTIISDHLLRIFQHVQHGDQTTFRKKFGYPLQIVKANPWVVLLALLLTIHGAPDVHMAVPAGYLVVAMLLSILWVLGNSVNHVYFASPFVAMLLSPYLFIHYLETFLLLGIAMGCFYLICREYSLIAKKQIQPHWFECFDWIKQKGLCGAILVLPEIACPPLVYYTDLKLISAGHGSRAMEFNRLFLGKNSSDPQFVRRFVLDAGVSFILLQKDRFRETEALTLKTVFQVLFQNDSLCLLTVRK